MHPSSYKKEPTSESVVERYAYNADRLGVEVKSLDFIFEKRLLTSKPHRADFYQLLWVSAGTLTLQLDFQQLVVQSGQVCFIGVGQVCRYDVRASFSHRENQENLTSSTAVEGISVLFSPEFLGEIPTDATLLRTLAPPLGQRTAIIPEDMAEFAHLLALLLDEYRRASHPLQCIVLQSYLRVALASLAKQQQQVDLLDEPVHLAEQFVDVVEEYFATLSNVADYLQILRVGEKVLSQAVRQVFGITPKVYIDQRRVLQAKRLLIYSPLSSKEIAYELGFDEPTNFHKFFRKHVGETPQEFRAKYTEK